MITATTSFGLFDAKIVPARGRNWSPGFAGSKLGKLTVPLLEEHARRTRYPERAIRADKKRLDHPVRQSLLLAIALELTPVVTIKPVLRSHPKKPGTILHKTGDVQVSQSLRVFTEAVALGQASERRKQKQCDAAKRQPDPSPRLE